jgi:hypothetical protein
MPNRFNRYNGKTHTVSATFTGGGAYDPAAIATRTIVFPCKDIRSINDVQLTCLLGYTVYPVALVHNAVQFRVYKTRLNEQGPAGAGTAVTVVGGVLDSGVASGAADDAGYSSVPVELPAAAAVTVTVRGIALGTG